MSSDKPICIIPNGDATILGIPNTLLETWNKESKACLRSLACLKHEATRFRIRVPSKPILVSRTGAAGRIKRSTKAPKLKLMEYYGRRWLLKIAGRVTTYLQKQLTLKMDGAEVSSLHSAVSGKWSEDAGRPAPAMKP
ncbi:hypothetical protein KM043_012383 [Ampulex compressa]|nr:hypothetical protein KM043_012383 [Ampulex compressa]